MTDERCNDKDQCRKYDQNAVQTHSLDLLRYGASDCVQQSGGRDCFAKRKTARGEDDDCPKEIVEVFFRQDTGAEEENNGYDGYDTHVPEDVFQLMGHAPEHYGHYSDSADKPLHACEFVFHRAYRYDRRALARLEGDKKKHPDEKDGDDADREGHEKPDAPTWLGFHVL